MSEILYLGEKDKTMEKHQALSFFLFPFFSLPFLVFFFFFWWHIAELSAHKPPCSGPPTQIRTQTWVPKGQFFPILAWPPDIKFVYLPLGLSRECMLLGSLSRHNKNLEWRVHETFSFHSPCKRLTVILLPFGLRKFWLGFSLCILFCFSTRGGKKSYHTLRSGWEGSEGKVIRWGISRHCTEGFPPLELQRLEFSKTRVPPNFLIFLSSE